MWFIGVEVEQETSAPPPKRNPGSAPVPFVCITSARLNPLPVFDAKKYQYHLTEIFHRSFCTNGKRSMYKVKELILHRYLARNSTVSFK